MLEKHHLGQTMDLHYNINGKLLELKGWCEVIQPAPSLSDRSHLLPHTRQQAGARHFVGAWCAGVLLSPDCPPTPPTTPTPTPTSIHPTTSSFFNTQALLFSNATSPHTWSSPIAYAPVASLSDVIFSEPLELCSYMSRCTGDKQRWGGAGGICTYKKCHIIYYIICLNMDFHKLNFESQRAQAIYAFIIAICIILQSFSTSKPCSFPF